ncbi:hypothetical protein BC835DRAFT_372336 [Cytidiella melzeri]|nr:hypothetical protein BC835DRAFT_372336 [Cytidiella melzeri]
MDNLVAIGAGLGLRALIDAVAHETVQATALVGLWEGVVLNHFMGKFPSSIDPYLAFGLRQFVDFLFTQSLMRTMIVMLWTGLGMLLADVAVQMSADRRFRRLWRRITRRFSLYSLAGSYAPSRSTRVRFFEIPGSSSTAGSRTTTAISPDSHLRPTTTPVPGQFDQWSVVSGPPRTTPESSTGTNDSPSRTPTEADHYDVPSRPRTPSELEYLTLPVIPDVPEPTPSAPVAGPSSRPQINIDVRPRDITPRNSFRDKHTKAKAAYDLDDKPAVNSGLTTPTSNPRSPLDDEDRPRVHSGLTTPEHLTVPLKVPVPEIPSSTAKTPLKQPNPVQAAPVRLTLAAPSPTVVLPQPLLTPMRIPPVSEIPNIPTPDDTLLARAENRTPPPSFQEALRAPSVVPDDVSSVGESVIAGKRNTIIAKADELRKLARDAEAERDRLRNELKKAEREKRHLDIVCLQVEYEEAQENINNLHAKAARRYYKAHNLNPAPQEIDVHRLSSEEAIVQVKKAIRDARGFGAPHLRIIVGKGKHSKDNVPVLKPAVISELQKLHIATEPDPKNAGVLIVKLPAGRFSAAGPAS